MLTQRFPNGSYRLVPRDQWNPRPKADDRAAWTSLPDTVRASFLAAAETNADKPWDALPASRYLDFARDGNRSRYQELFFSRRQRLGTLVLAECVEDQGRFLDPIVDGLWLIAEESSWCLPAHIAMQKAGMGLPDIAEPIVDLFAAETGVLAAWTLYLLGTRLDRVSPLVRPRLERDIQTRLLAPCLQRDDFWWMGNRGNSVNNWNPWIISNWLACALLVESDDSIRAEHVTRAVRSLDHFVAPYPADGGCDEGPGYWGRAGASLYDCLEILRSATGGQFDVYDDPVIRNIGRFIYRVHIADRYFVNFADAPAMAVPSPGVVFGYGRRIQDADMRRLGAWAALLSHLRCPPVNGKPPPRTVGSLARTLEELFLLDDIDAEDPTPPLPKTTWLDVIEVLVARDQAGSTRGFCLAAKGGHNAESHNHNDVGQFIVYIDGRPLLVDAGVESYTRKTFSPQRYELWTMQSLYHNLPTIDGVQQAPGREFASRGARFSDLGSDVRLELDLAGAYPAAAGLRTWTRTVTLARERQIRLEDRYERNAGAPGTVTLSLLTPASPDTSTPGRIFLREAPLSGDRMSASATLSFNPDRFDVTVNPVELTDEGLRSIWGARLNQLVLSLRNPAAEDGWSITIERAMAGG